MSIKVNQSADKKAFPKRIVFSVIGLIVIPAIFYFVWQSVMGDLSRPNDAQFSNTIQTTTSGFQGQDLSTIDPEVAQAFCEDNLARFDLDENSKIIDSCLSDTVTREWLSNLSDIELQGIIDDNPTCLTTGFDANGYNCVTGFNEQGCNADNLREDGTLCEEEVVTQIENQPVVNPILNQTGDVCDILSTCESESEFDDSGFNQFNCDRAGRRPDGSLCPYDQVTKIYKDNKDQFGFSRDGFNDSGCDARGLTRQGEKCALSDVTRLYGVDSKDQFGFFSDGFNENNCSFDGLDRQGDACAFENITRVFDPRTGKDQFGFGRDKFNDNGCDINGFNRQGEICPIEDVTRIVGKNGLDHRGLFANNTNSLGCSVDGKRRDGSACAIEDIPVINSIQTGLSPLNLFENGFSQTGCSITGFDSQGNFCPLEDIPRIFDEKTGLDQFSLSADGFNDRNCNVYGYNRSGQRCALEDIPRIFNPNTNLDQFGLTRTGLTPQGCDLDGKREDGTICEEQNIPRLINPVTGVDQFSLNERGFNAQGCSLSGLRADGTVCDLEDIPRIFDAKTGFDQLGFNRENVNASGCGFDGRRTDGSFCAFEDVTRVVGKDGRDQNALDDNGLDMNNCSISGLDANGKPCERTVRQPSSRDMSSNDGTIPMIDTGVVPSGSVWANLGFVDGNYNANGCDIRGLRRDGSLCPFEDITRVFDSETNLDQFGLNPEGYNQFNCDIYGKDRLGNECLAEHVPQLFDSEGNNQFGQSFQTSPIAKRIAAVSNALRSIDPEIREELSLDAQGYSVETGCNLQGVRRDGSHCELEDIPRLFDSATGRDQFGLTEEGFNEFNCSLSGRKPNGDACDPSEITEILNPEGKNQFGERVSGIPKNNKLYQNGGAQKFAELIGVSGNLPNPDVLTEERLAALDLDENFRNAKGCGIDGLDVNGRVCPLEDIPRIFDPITDLDQFGFTRSNRNINGCDWNGKTRDGSLCDVNDMTRIYGKDGFDQRGFDSANFNRLGLDSNNRNIHQCDISGRKPDGSECAKDERIQIPGMTISARDYLESTGVVTDELLNGTNDQDCNIQGFKSNGQRCDLDEVPRVFNSDGTDQFGLRRNNRNIAGCDLQGRDPEGNLCQIEDITRIYDPVTQRDQFGLDRQGFNEFMCDLNGRRPDGSICPIEQITRIRGVNGEDQFGIFPDGFTSNNCSLEGVNREGEICPIEDIPMITGIDGISQLGITTAGFADNGCSITGLNRQGEKCAIEDVPKLFASDGFDQFNLDENLRNEKGCSVTGFRENGERCDVEDIPRVLIGATDQFGFNADGVNEQTGCDVSNKDKFGNPCHPSFSIKIIDDNNVDQFGMIDGFNENRCDLNGRKPDGSLCEFEEITRVVDPESGLDQFSLNEEGRTEIGCGLDGRMPDGSLCAPKDIPRIFDSQGVDQLGLTEGGFSSETGCNLFGLREDGTECNRDTTPFILGENGLTHLNVNAEGFNRDKLDAFGFDVNNCDINNKRPDGTPCPKIDPDIKLTANDAARVQYFKDSQLQLLGEYMQPGAGGAGIGQGTIDDSTLVYQPASFTPNPSVVSTLPVPLQNTAQATQSLEQGAQTNGNGLVEVPLGATMNVHIETSVNTDYTETVWGTIIGGELDGALLRGRVEVPFVDDPVMPRDKIRYLFDAIVWERRTYPINAVSLSYEDLNEFLDGDTVDYHRIQRFGGLLGAIALQALGATFLDSTEERALNRQAELTEQSSAILLGQNTRNIGRETTRTVTDEAASLARQQYNRRPTVEKGPSSVMIVFMEEVDDDNLPVVFSDIRN